MSGRIVSNTIYNMIGYAIPILITIVTAPIYIHHVGLARYGMLTITWIITGYTIALDVGLSRATARYLSATSFDDLETRRKIMTTSVAFLSGIGVVGSTGLYFLLFYLAPQMEGVGGDIASEYASAIPYVCVAFFATLLGGVATASMESRSEFKRLNVISSSTNVLGQIAPLTVALLFGPNLNHLILATVIVRVAGALATAAISCRQEGFVPVGMWDRTWLRQMIGYGGWVTVTNFVSPIMASLDSVLIGWYLGPAMVPYYSIPMSLINRALLFPGAIVRVLFPLLARGNEKDNKQITHLSLLVISTVVGSGCLAGILFGHAIMAAWLHQDFADKSAPLFMILLIGAYFNSLAYVGFSTLQAVGRPRQVALLHLSELPLYLAFFTAAMPVFALMGAALAWTTRVTLDCLALLRFSRLLDGIKISIILNGGALIAAAVVSAFAPSLFGNTVYWCVAAALFVALPIAVFLSTPGHDDLMQRVKRQISSRGAAVELR